ncbi:MAG: hypothetical protein KKA73_24235 [Chloroflexi bacterium]|nr:hypothetical protein [Chloroflexota bacterium]MBU1750802.1 hypothetical protein [Chloroflexota bacterium]
MSETQQDLRVSTSVHAMARNVIFVLLGVAALVLKRHYSGPFVEIIYSYGGNVSASFAVYFVFRIFTSSWILTSGWRYGRLVTAGIALLVVELFEATNGFGVMTNTYDPVDYLANALGIALAYWVDLISARLIQANSPRN